jgi:L-fuconolactonase
VLSGGYDRVWDGLSQLFDELAALDRANILGATAQKFYGIDPVRLTALGPQKAE